MCAVFNNYVISVSLSFLFQFFNNKVVYHPLFKSLLPVLTKHSTITENLSLCLALLTLKNVLINFTFINKTHVSYTIKCL